MPVTLLDIPQMSNDVAAAFGSTPGYAIGMSNPSPDDAWYRYVTSNVYAAGIGVGIADRLFTEFCHAHTWGDSRSLGGGFEASTTRFLPGYVAGVAKPTGEGSGAGFGQYLPVCTDDARYDGHGSVNIYDGRVSLLLGGNRCQSKAGSFLLNAGTGDQPITGVGFEPHIVIFLGCMYDSGGSLVDGGNFMLGAMDADGNQWVGSLRSAFFFVPCTRKSRWNEDACISHIGAIPLFSGPITQDQLASFVSMDADGFTINLSQAGLDSNGNQMRVSYLAIRADDGYGAFSVGSATQGDTSIAVGSAPDAMVFFSTQNDDPGSTITTGGNAVVGCTDGLLQRSYWCGANAGTGLAVSQIRSYTSTAAAIRMGNPFETTLAAADVTLTGTGCDLDWITDDGGGRRFGWISLQTDTEPEVHEATTLPATLITAHTAQMNAEVTPNSPNVESYRFQWGAYPGPYTNATPWAVAGVGDVPIPVDAGLTGLALGVYYHYRVEARNAVGCILDANDVVFRTALAPIAGRSGGIVRVN